MEKPTTDDLIEEILRLREADQADALERDSALGRRVAALEAWRWWHGLARWLRWVAGA